MRLSNNLMYQGNINKILENQQNVANAQERANTGKKYLTTSEGPAAISQAMLFTNSIEKNVQYTKNINQLNGRLDTEETVLKSINLNIQSAEMLTIQAGNGSYDAITKQGIAGELHELQQSILSLVNTRAEDGKFIFSGYQDSSQTYTFDSTNNEYVYGGDQGQHKITITEGVDIKSSDNGFDIFEKVDARLNVVSNDGTLTPSLTKGTVYVDKQSEFDTFHEKYYNPDPAATATANTINVVITAGVAGAPDQYEIMQDGLPFVPAVVGEYTDGETIEFAGMKLNLEGSAPGQMDFELEKPKKENILNTLESLINGLNDSSLSEEDYQQVLATGLIQLKSASEQVVFTQASLGGRMKAIDQITDSNSGLDINNKASRSDLIEIDTAAAISDLGKQEVALQVSQATFGRLANLSLFDYL